MENNLKQTPSTCVKIVLYGPESTGKSTLALALASYYKTRCVPEFARDFLQEKWNQTQQACTEDDMQAIAEGQMQAENDVSKSANEWLFLDTNLLTTKVYSDIYFNKCNNNIRKAAYSNQYALYFLTDIDTPWVADDLRDKPAERAEMLDAFEQELIALKLPYFKLSGNHEKRLETAITFLTYYQEMISLGFHVFDAIQTFKAGISIDKLKKELEIFEEGIVKTVLDRPATLNDGILPLDASEAVFYEHFFENRKQGLKLKKFVPASGAASRMFKFLVEFLQDFKPERESINAYINRKKTKAFEIFLVGMPNLPFYKNIIEFLKANHEDYDLMRKDEKAFLFITTMIDNPQFDFANKPKGILPFHDYSGYVLNPVQEHLKEAIAYASSDGRAYLHFTISPEHQEAFESIIQDNLAAIEKENNIKMQVRFSFQHAASDTLAVNLDGTPFRLENGALFFRPGGHGALIENLNQLNADVVFIKNIDNVIQNNSDTIAHYKKALGGILLSIQEQVFEYLRILETSNLKNEIIDEVIRFMETKLNIMLIPEFQFFTKEYKIDHLRKYLNRPIRVCGMVKNEDEPGGGPFWVRDNRGVLSLQIVESVQVDVNVVKQSKIMRKATHFNPVDLVCGIKNYHGNPFDLCDYIDHDSGFITEKNKNGKPLLAYELPGLWNGAMAKWISIFVEVPLVTFNPVKTVNDLLKNAHQE
jgi:nicotinamide riboside kinase